MRRLIPALLFLAACDNPVAPIPDGAVEMRSIPEFYQVWWDEVLVDTGMSADMSRVRFYFVPGGPWPTEDGKHVEGLWVKKGRRIYLSENYIFYAPTVRHEMLHEILQRPDHNHPLFSTPEY